VSAILHYISLLRLLPELHFKISTFQPIFLCSSSFKGAMPVSFYHNCLHITFNHTLAVNPTPVNIRNCKIYPHNNKNITEKVYVEKVWPANLASFIYVSIRFAKTVKVDSVVQR